MNWFLGWDLQSLNWWVNDWWSIRRLMVNRRKFRSLEVKLPSIWTDGKAEVWRVKEEKKRSEKIREEKEREEKMQVHEEGRKVAIHCVFQWFVALEGWKVGSLQRRVQSPLARWEMTNCTPLWREAHFEAKMYKTHHSRTTFGSWDVKKCTPL